MEIFLYVDGNISIHGWKYFHACIEINNDYRKRIEIPIEQQSSPLVNENYMITGTQAISKLYNNYTRTGTQAISN